METRRALDLSVQEFIYAGLDALAAFASLDVCAYLNRSDATGDQLFLCSPRLAVTGAAKSFEIFTALADALDRPRHRDRRTAAGRAEDAVEIAGTPAVLVITAGAASRGVHAFGRRQPFDGRERAALANLAGAVGVAVHRLQAAREDVPTTP